MYCRDNVLLACNDLKCEKPVYIFAFSVLNMSTGRYYVDQQTIQY